MKVLETRKTALQKEQGMAFARAAAAGFSIDDMAPLMSFAERFGASRLRYVSFSNRHSVVFKAYILCMTIYSNVIECFFRGQNYSWKKNGQTSE